MLRRSNSIARFESGSPSRRRSLVQRGAVLAEFAIIFPIVIFLVLAFIDFARYYYYRGLAAASAQRGISSGQLIANLENVTIDPPTGQPAEDDPIIQAINTQALELISNSMGVPVISSQVSPDTHSHLPTVYIVDNTNSGGEVPAFIKLPETLTAIPRRSVISALRQDPLELSFPLHIGSISPWLPDMVVQVIAAGYREIGPEPANPRPTDCNGMIVQDPNAPVPVCACPGENVAPIQRIGGQCICTTTGQEASTAEDCPCPENQFFDTGLLECICVPCPSLDQVQDPACSCACPACSTLVPGEPDPSGASTPPTCECNTDQCPTDQHLAGCCCLDCPGLTMQDPGDPSICSCPPDIDPLVDCPALNDIFNPVRCICELCSEQHQTSSDGLNCECPFQLILDNIDQYCGDNEYFNGQSGNGGTCECLPCPNGQVRDPNDPGSCVCPDNAALCGRPGSGSNWDPTTCTCVTCNPQQESYFEGQCICNPNGNGPGELTCPGDTIYTGTPGNCCAPCAGQSQANNGICECLLDPVKLAGECLALGQDSNVDPDVCDCVPCPNDSHIFNGQDCVCSNNCPTGQTHDEDCVCEPIECDGFGELIGDTCECNLDCDSIVAGGTLNDNCTCNCPAESTPSGQYGHCLPCQGGPGNCDGEN